MPCHCKDCDKEPAPTYTEAYKMECLKRHNLAVKICEMTDRQERSAEIERYGQKRGSEAMGKLKEVVNSLWKTRKL